MGFRAFSDYIQEQLQAVLRLDCAKIGAVRPELAEEEHAIGNNTLTNDGDSDAGRGRFFRRDNLAQAVRVGERRVAERIQLMRGPEIRRKLLHKLCRSVDPIRMFKLRRKMELSESLQPIP